MTVRPSVSAMIADAPAGLHAFEKAPLTRLHLAIVILCACGFAIDLSELALGSALSIVFSAPPHKLPGAELSWLLSSAFLGAIVGAPLMGWVADRVGLKTALALALLWLAGSSILAGLSVSPVLLILFRLLSGLALGAFPPLVISYLTDISPVARRGSVIFATCAFAYLGPPAVIFGMRGLSSVQPYGVEGWRWPFLGAGVLSLVVGIALFWAPEAPHWLEATGRKNVLDAVLARFRHSSPLRSGAGGRGKAASIVPVSAGTVARQDTAANATPHWRARLAGAGLLYFLIPWATVAFPLVTGPTLLARHYSLSDALLFVGLSTFGPILGTFAGGTAIDRLDRRWFMAACALAMLGSIALFFGGQGPIAAATAMVAFGIFSALFLPAMTMFGAELFDARTRGRATTFAWVANRVGATLAPLALVPLVHSGQYGLVGAVMCGALAATFLALKVLPRP